MSGPLPEWRATRGPCVGEDIVAWAQEQAGEAIRESVEGGHVFVAVDDPDGEGIVCPAVRFIIAEARRGDPHKSVPLDEALAQEIDDSCDGDGRLDPNFREKFAALRDVLRKYADILDRRLAESGSP